jgi:hypothetical protein
LFTVNGYPMDALESDYGSKDSPSIGQKARSVAPPEWSAWGFFAHSKAHPQKK